MIMIHNNIKQLVLLILFCSIVCTSSLAGQQPIGYPRPEFPVPPDSDGKLLFYIQRSMNPNTVVYEANLLDNGKINPDEPVKFFWRRYNTTGEKKDLFWYERIIAYGIEHEPDNNGGYYVNIVSHRKLKAHLYINMAGDVRFETTLSGRIVNLISAYVLIDDNYTFLPKIIHVDVYGIDITNGNQVHERITP